MNNEKAEKSQGKKNIEARAQISVRLPRELLDRIQGLAEQERRTRSNMIAYLLREKLRETAEK